MSDDEVLKLAQASCIRSEAIAPEVQAGIDAIFARIRDTVVRLCIGWTGNRALAEDIAQESLAIAWRRLPEFRFEASFQSFVIGICRNRVRSDRRRISERLTDDGLVEATSDVADAFRALRDEEQEDVLLNAIADLPQDEQAALHLRYVEGASVEAITAELALQTASGARGLLVKARRRLGTRLRDALDARGHGSSFFRTSIS